jgi:hypothetical protein
MRDLCRRFPIHEVAAVGASAVSNAKNFDTLLRWGCGNQKVSAM